MARARARERRLAILLGLFVSTGALAQGAPAYPTKPVRFVIGYPAGGVVDIVARALGAKYAEAMGQPVIVDNRVGASGNIATDIVAKSQPDGHTMLLATVVDAVSPSLFPKLPFDLLRDLAPVSLTVDYPFYLVVNPALPARNVPELVALARAKPGTLNFASSGNGSSPHLAGEMFRQMAGIDIVHVPYKGAAPVVADLVGGQVQLAYLNSASALPLVKAGRLRVLAVSSPKRVPQTPEVPTMIELGFAGFVANSWFGVMVRAGTPASIVERLNAETRKALAAPEVKERFDAQALEIVPSSPQEFRALVSAEIAKYARIVKQAGLKIE